MFIFTTNFLVWPHFAFVLAIKAVVKLAIKRQNINLKLIYIKLTSFLKIFIEII